MRRAAGWVVAFGVLGTMAPAPSRAADDAPSRRKADAFFEQGMARIRAKDFEAARQSFAQAYAVRHSADILFDLALSEQESGHWVDAIAHLKEYARGAISDTDRATADKHLRDLMASTGHVELSAPAGADLRLDGVSVGVAPRREPVDVFPGRHRFEARLAQGSKTQDVDVEAGQVLRVSLFSEDSGTPSTQAAAASPVDGPAPSASPPLPPAGATDRALRAARGPSHDVADGQTGEDDPGRIATVVTVGGLAIAAGALGVAFGIGANDSANAAAGLRAQFPSTYCSTPANAAGSTCIQWNDTVHTQNEDAALSTAFYVAGGVLAASAVAVWLLWPKRPQTTMAIVPTLGPMGAGITGVARF